MREESRHREKKREEERRRAVVKLPRAREKEREEDTVCSVVHNIVSRDVISEIHTRETQVSYVTHELKKYSPFLSNFFSSLRVDLYLIKYKPFFTVSPLEPPKKPLLAPVCF